MHNNSKKWYITDQTPIDLYFILTLFKHRSDLFKNAKTQIEFEKVFGDNFKAESTVSRNSFIFFGEKNSAWYSFENRKILNHEVDMFISNFMIDDFLDYFYERVINQKFVEYILENVDDEFETNDAFEAYKKMPEEIRNLTLLDFDPKRDNRPFSTLLKMLCSYEIIGKLNKKGRYTKNIENSIRVYPLTWNGIFSSYSSLTDFNDSLIKLFSGQKVNANLLFEKELFRRTKLSSFVRNSTYEKRTVIKKEDQGNALYDYLFTDKSTRDIDLEYSNSVSSNAMYINATANYYNLDKESRKWFDKFDVTKSDALKIIDKFVENYKLSTNDSVAENQVFSNRIDDLFVGRGIKRTASKRDPNSDKQAAATAQKNGDAAERFVFSELKKSSIENLRSILKMANEEVVKEIVDVFSVDSNAGYDILVETNKAKYTIEVKNISSSNKGSFFISANELKKLKENQNAFIALRTTDDIRLLNFNDICEFVELIPQSFSATFRLD